MAPVVPWRPAPEPVKIEGRSIVQEGQQVEDEVPRDWYFEAKQQIDLGFLGGHAQKKYNDPSSRLDDAQHYLPCCHQHPSRQDLHALSW